jgi:hypothetical protein
MDRTEALAAIAGIPAQRAELDGVERGAIDAARRAGASWTDIAAALGLHSRQAAEQRRLRLGAADAASDPAAVRARRRRQQNLDTRAGTAIIALRAAAADLATGLERAPTRPSIRLALTTLRMAADAEPGPLVDLVRLALADLESVDLETSVRALVMALTLSDQHSREG